jgi:hypothetical protein
MASVNHLETGRCIGCNLAIPAERRVDQSDRAPELAVSAPSQAIAPLANGATVLDKIAHRKALEALDGLLAATQANGSLPPGALAGIATHAKSTANDAVKAAERMQRHVAAIETPPRRS